MSLKGFWEKVDETTPEALSGMSLEQLHEYYDYFALANRDVGNAADIRAAKERLELLQRAIDRGHSRAQHKQTRKLTLIGMALTAIGILVGIARCPVDRPPANVLRLHTNSASPTSQPTPIPPSSPTIAATVGPTTTATPAMTPKESPVSSPRS